MTARIQVEVEGQDKWLRRLAGIERRLDDFEPLGRELEPIVYGHLRRWMDTEGDGDWAPLSPAYAEWKAIHYPGRKILEREGDLRESLFGPDARYSVRRIDRDGGEWGTNAPYARYHQFSKRATLPRRQVVVMNNDLRKDFLAVVREFTRRTLAAGG